MSHVESYPLDHRLPWGPYDFLVNATYWAGQPAKVATEIRLSNLKELTSTMDNFGLVYWLQGQTLLDISRTGVLGPDHDDDIGVWETDWHNYSRQIVSLLEGAGFRQIRSNGEISSFERFGRYVDICLFKNKYHLVGYGGKYFPASLFKAFVRLRVDDFSFSVPKQTRRVSFYLRYVVPLARTFRKVRAFFQRVRLRAVLLTQRGSCLRTSLWPPSRTQISMSEFLELNIEPDDSFNLWWREPHLRPILQSPSTRRLRDIFNYFSQKGNLEKSLAVVSETETRFILQEPIAANYEFWRTGNNFFLYCLAYGLRKNVVPYRNINRYIRNGLGKPAFTKEYYEELDAMSANEAEEFLYRHPIEIQNGNIVGGKHRALAVLGSLLKGVKLERVWVCILPGPPKLDGKKL